MKDVEGMGGLMESPPVAPEELDYSEADLREAQDQPLRGNKTRGLSTENDNRHTTRRASSGQGARGKGEVAAVCEGHINEAHQRCRHGDQGHDNLDLEAHSYTETEEGRTDDAIETGNPLEAAGGEGGA